MNKGDRVTASTGRTGVIMKITPNGILVLLDSYWGKLGREDIRIEGLEVLYPPKMITPERTNP